MKTKARRVVRRPAAAGRETVLFAVTGMSPAVLTETVWALARETPAVIPNRVVVLTTKVGAAQIGSELLAPRPEFQHASVWETLRTSLLPDKRRPAGLLRFGDTPDDIRPFTMADPNTGRSRVLEDIRTPEENAAAADTLLEHLRAFTENPDVRVIASIAGGRKTMGALLYAAMTLLGRDDDRLTHVLVNEPFDDPRLQPRFYFPTQPTATLRTADGRNVSARQAHISLADLPFVPIRNRFEDIAEMPGRFTALVHKYSRELRREAARKALVQVDDPSGTVTVDGVQVHLRARARQTLRFLLHVNAQKLIPVGQIEAVPPLQEFLGATYDWVNSADDLKREISEIRRVFTEAGIRWRPGERSHSLHLPPFTVKPAPKA